MGWKDHPHHRCKHCGAPIHKKPRQTENGREEPNQRKRCLVCGKEGCDRCTEFSKKNVLSGRVGGNAGYRHSKCQRPAQ